MKQTGVTRQSVEDVVVVLPGILGSELKRDGKVVWSSSRNGLFRNLLKRAGPVYELELDPDRFDDKEALDGVVAESLIPDTHMIPGLWTIDGYSKLASRIKDLPGVEPGRRNCFERPYDWRLDNRVAARRLAQLAEQWIDLKSEARLVLVAHSMGGLVSRYFLEVLDGWRRTKGLITIGTPYRGSLQALDFVANGLSRGIGPVRLIDLTNVIRSLPSAYQLLPTYRCWSQEVGDFLELSEVEEIPGIDSGKLAKARAFHQEIEDAAAANAKIEEYVERRYTIDPIAGVNQPTPAVSRARRRPGPRCSESYRDEDRDGDGRVMREIATPEQQLRPVYANQRHAALQNDDAVITQIQAILSTPRSELRDVPAEYQFARRRRGPPCRRRADPRARVAAPGHAPGRGEPVRLDQRGTGGQAAGPAR